MERHASSHNGRINGKSDRVGKVNCFNYREELTQFCLLLLDFMLQTEKNETVSLGFDE